MTSILKVSSIQDPTNSNTALTIGTNGLIQPKQVAFQVTGSDLDQSISAATNTKLEWDTTPQLDTAGYWDATNHRYTPQVAGWYLFGGVVRLQTPTINGFLITKLSKNGGTAAPNAILNQIQFDADRINNGNYPLPSGIFQLNGSSDYVEVQIRGDEAMVASDNTNDISIFFGFLVHAT
jgi:hypothetical protein